MHTQSPHVADNDSPSEPQKLVRARDTGPAPEEAMGVRPQAGSADGGVDRGQRA
jgi:hypothetical protein